MFSFNFRYDDNEYETATSLAQHNVENVVGDQYMRYIDPDTLEDGGEIDDTQYRLQRIRHEYFIRDSISGKLPLPKQMDALQPWLVFWSLNSLAIMGCEISPELAQGALETLQSMQDPNGGFGGGNRQVPHLADTYAAVMALALLESEDALGIVDREKMLGWLIRMKQSDGSFCMHEDGEVDVRGTYCALVIASLLNIMTPEVTEGCAEFIAKCQTWEGGISLYPGVEAHGGYTLCGLAALEILGRSDILDLKRLSRWMILRQLPFEGGFNGRANKLVDGCYSYWQGGSFVLLQKALKRSQAQDYLFDREALQRYVLACCQARDRRGGLRDKPGKSSDLYHTMYVLCGLSLAQHYVGVEPEKIVSSTESVYSVPVRMMQWGAILKGLNVLGHRSNLVKPIHPVYAIPFSPLAKAVKYFYSLPPLAETLH